MKPSLDEAAGIPDPQRGNGGSAASSSPGPDAGLHGAGDRPMPLDTPGDGDTVRLPADGTIGRAGSMPPVPGAPPLSGPPGPGAGRYAADGEPAAPSDTQVIPSVPPAAPLGGPPAEDSPRPTAGDLGDGPPVPPTAPASRPQWRRPAVLVPAAAVLALGVAYGVDL